MTKVKNARNFTVVYVNTEGKADVAEVVGKDDEEARSEFCEVYDGLFTKIAGITDQGPVKKSVTTLLTVNKDQND